MTTKKYELIEFERCPSGFTQEEALKSMQECDEPNWDYGLRKLKPLLKNFKLNKPQKVKIRKNGVTSNGRYAQCNTNAHYMALKYGGRAVCGLVLADNKNGYIGLTGHSVWETPEGKLVDVTLKWTGRDEILFFPYKRYESTTDYYEIPNDFDVADNTYYVTNVNKECIAKLSTKELKKLTGAKYNLLDESLNHISSTTVLEKTGLSWEYLVERHIKIVETGNDIAFK